MKFTAILITAILLTSCLSISRIERNCDKFAKICAETPQIITKYRDTTIFVEKKVFVDKIIEVPVPYYKDSVRIRDSVVIRDGYCYLSPVIKETGIIAVKASVDKSVINIMAWLTDSTFLYNYKDTLTLSDSITIYNAIREQNSSQLVITPPEKYIPGFYKFTFWLFIIAVIIFILYLLNKKLKLPFK